MTREIPIPITVNNRHVHLSKEDADTIFGQSHNFTVDPNSDKHLWPGHTLWKEKVTLSGPNGTIDNVSILGPLHGTSVEMSATDAYRLGLNTDGIKEKKFGPGLTITGPKAKVFVKMDQPVNGRWLLTSKTRAEKHGLREGMLVDVRVGTGSGYATTFHNFQVIIETRADKDPWAVYLDADSASAASVRAGETAVLVLRE